MRAHGTRAKYASEGCRCDQCRQANREYERRRSRQRLAESYGVADPVLSDAAPVRAHIDWLRSHGIGLRRIADLSSVSRATIQDLAGGKQSRIRRETADKILAVRPDIDNVGGATRIPAGSTARRLQALIAIGYPRNWLAWKLGRTSANMSIHLHDDSHLVHAATYRDVKALYEQLHMTPAPPSYSATRARMLAARRGWVPPLDWDDIEAGVPADDADSGKGCPICEDIAHLRFMGETVNEVIAKRLGITRDTLWRHLDRHGRLDLWAEVAS